MQNRKSPGISILGLFYKEHIRRAYGDFAIKSIPF